MALYCDRHSLSKIPESQNDLGGASAVQDKACCPEPLCMLLPRNAIDFLRGLTHTAHRLISLWPSRRPEPHKPKYLRRHYPWVCGSRESSSHGWRSEDLACWPSALLGIDPLDMHFRFRSQGTDEQHGQQDMGTWPPRIALFQHTNIADGKSGQVALVSWIVVAVHRITASDPGDVNSMHRNECLRRVIL